MEMPLRNIEGHGDFNIAPDWYRHRLPGISAYIRTKGEERWIGPTIESILDFFDEIVVTLDNVDRTKDIINRFRSPKIKIFDYPFQLKPFGQGYDKTPMGSVHSFAYYTNWSVSKTMYSHVCRWDGDMIMLPEFKENKRSILKKNIVRFKGYDVVTPDFAYMSKTHPYAGPEPRIHKIDKRIFYYQMPLMEGLNYQGLTQLFYLSRWKTFPSLQLQRITNLFTKKDVTLDRPAFLHMKFLKDWKTKYARNEQANWDDPFYKDLIMMHEAGNAIPDEIPACAFKQLEEYL
jgi:hypothetical protein